MKSYLKRIAQFVAIGLVLYAGVYYFSETLVYRYGKANRFYQIKTSQISTYDYVFLGASHPMPFDYKDMNARLEEMTGSRIINVATPGNGIVLNRFILEYLLQKRNTRNVVYFLDSFVLYSQAWNEDRFKDVKLFQRAPFDFTLAKMLFNYTFQEGIAYTVFLDYLSGFSKINNRDRFKPDVREDEAKFDRKYRFIASRDMTRIKYLYPSEKIDERVFNKYLKNFLELADSLKAKGIGLIVIKAPIPSHIYAMLPQEKEFDEKIKTLLDEKNVPFYDFSMVANNLEYFYDTDHLNRTGVLNFFEKYLQPVLIRHAAAS
jgi:hypothetical protein